MLLTATSLSCGATGPKDQFIVLFTTQLLIQIAKLQEYLKKWKM
jgi:hypothetical protein